MSPSHPLPAIRRLAAAGALLLLAGCAGGFRRADGAFTSRYPGSPGPYPAAAPLPAGLVAEGGLKPLAGARYAGVGPLGALVVPVSIGDRVPTHDERTLAARLFGEGTDDPGTVRELLTRESGGALRFTTRTLPLLVAPRWRGAPGQRGELERLAQMALGSWARQLDLGVYDNDGPDGVPSSRDDDGEVDLVILTVESDVPFPTRIVPARIELRGGRGRLRAGHVLAVHVPRGAAPDVLGATRLVLHTLGLGEAECFFPDGFGRTLSTLARTRLGWLAASAVPRSGTFRFPEGHGVVVPLTDVPAGFWLLERERGEVRASRVARGADGHFFATRVERLAAGTEHVLPLTRQMGARGPRVRLFDEGGDARMQVVLDARLAAGASPLEQLDAPQPVAPRPAGPRAVPTTPLDP